MSHRIHGPSGADGDSVKRVGMAAADERDDPEPAIEPVQADDQGSGTVDQPRCDLCGAPMQEWHCRIICTFCGYQRDCSDP